MAQATVRDLTSSTFFTLWALAALGGLVVKGVQVRRRRGAAAADRARIEAEERRSRPERERAEREAAERKRRDEADRRRREDAREACELLYAQHAPEVGSRLPQATFEEFVKKLLRDDLPPDLVERKAAEVQSLIRSHIDQARGGKKPETVGQVQAWFAEQKQQLLGVSDERLRESFEALLLQQFHERMLRALGDEG